MFFAQEYKRVSCIGILFGIAYVGLLARLYIMQIVHHDFFTELGAKQYAITVTQQAKRGLITDRHGTPLALNSAAQSAFITPCFLREPKTLYPFLQQEFHSAYEKLLAKKDKKFMFIARHINKQTEEKLKNVHHKDIYFLEEPARVYPAPACASIVGSVDIDNHGIAGCELSLNTLLAGRPAMYAVQKDAHADHFYFEKKEIEQATPGLDVSLTIDATLQYVIQEKLANYAQENGCVEGGAIILDPGNGDILCMTSFIANDQSFDAKMKNTCVAHAYEFGSICKLFVAAAALEEGLVTIDELIDCKNKKTARVDGRIINTWKAHGILSFKQVIALSNNIGIAIVAKRLDTLLYKHYKELGFGSKLPVALPGKHAGFLQDPAHWSKQSLISLSYGYELSVTLLHLASAVATFAHEGHRVYPRLLLTDQIQIGQKLYSPQTVNQIKEILEETTTRGTAHRAKIQKYSVLCKTGSAHRVVDGFYSKDNNIYSCIGIVEKDLYKRVVAVYVQKNGSGQEHTFASTMAAPLFNTIASYMLVHDHVIS
ncbi:penicillin-binding protein 2 [Candidatus Dependentiae bacterium]|nr:MAG: penicillin-binding protein 2 [Candidatus Dependentiae bacterium]